MSITSTQRHHPRTALEVRGWAAGGGDSAGKAVFLDSGASYLCALTFSQPGTRTPKRVFLCTYVLLRQNVRFCLKDPSYYNQTNKKSPRPTFFKWHGCRTLSTHIPKVPAGLLLRSSRGPPTEGMPWPDESGCRDPARPSGRGNHLRFCACTWASATQL